MRKVRILIADDHTIVRQGMRKLLETYPDFHIIEESRDGAEAVEAVARLRPDLVIMDISMPGLNGLEATREIKKQFPEMRILILTMHAEKEYIFKILQSGASGYLLKGASVEELVTAIRAVDRGESYLNPPASKSMMEDYLRAPHTEKEAGSPQSLTAREKEILQMIAEGYTSKNIATKLCLSSKTIETHRAHIMQKLDIHHAAGLIRYAIQKGWVEVSKA